MKLHNLHIWDYLIFRTRKNENKSRSTSSLLHLFQVTKFQTLRDIKWRVVGQKKTDVITKMFLIL